MKLYTGKGDKGTTTVFNSAPGHRISKSSCNIESLGTIDELNSFLGIVKSISIKANDNLLLKDLTLANLIHQIQEDLFIIQAELAGADKSISSNNLDRIEKQIADITDILSPINSFLIPGGTELSANLDYARALARKAERVMVSGLEKKEIKVSDITLGYLNRLSTILYVCVRLVNQNEKVSEVKPSY